MGYEYKIENLETNILGKVDATDVLALDNTTPFTPDADYEPATKKYVDDKVYYPNALTVDDTYQILVTDYTVICNKATSFTVTLPTAVVGQIFTIKNINTGIVTLEGSGADTIDGNLNLTIDQWDAVKLQCYIANKWVII